jgi:hypothetical protein
MIEDCKMGSMLHFYDVVCGFSRLSVLAGNQTPSQKLWIMVPCKQCFSRMNQSKILKNITQNAIGSHWGSSSCNKINSEAVSMLTDSIHHPFRDRRFYFGNYLPT